jgi:hypothetical protein
MKPTYITEQLFVFDEDDLEAIPLDRIIKEYKKINFKKYENIHLNHTDYPDYRICIEGTRLETLEECKIHEEKHRQETIEFHQKERARLEKSIRDCQERLDKLNEGGSV